jgi:formylmethanofuran dehydrogenase subunit E
LKSDEQKTVSHRLAENAEKGRMLMKREKISEESVRQATDFHGHWCPGLAIGIRASELALAEVGRASDEDIVAVVETDMCAVDAIQYLTGCTFGKGNLIHKDYGKNAFSFYRRRDGKALRILTKQAIFKDTGPLLRTLHKKMLEEGLTAEEEKVWKETRQMISQRVMESPLEELFEVKEPPHPVPERARILASVTCDACGEPVMETRTVSSGGRVLCVPCAEAAGR